MNDLPSATTFHTRLYADDTDFFMCDISLDALNKKVNNELNNIDRWLKSKKISLNYAKTKFMKFLMTKILNRSLKLRSIKFLFVTVFLIRVNTWELYLMTT